MVHEVVTFHTYYAHIRSVSAVKMVSNTGYASWGVADITALELDEVIYNSVAEWATGGGGSPWARRAGDCGDGQVRSGGGSVCGRGGGLGRPVGVGGVRGVGEAFIVAAVIRIGIVANW